MRAHARKSYRFFRENPHHPSLQFKKVGLTEDIYSARVGLGHRALGRLDGDTIIWFWIGAHDPYVKRI